MKLFGQPSNLLLNQETNLFRPLALATLSMTSFTASADVMLGAYLPHDGFSQQEIIDFNNVVPKQLAFVNVFSAFTHDWNNLYWQSSNVVSNNAYPMISWMPVDLSRPDDNLLPEIAAGLWDDYLLEWGTKLLSWTNSYPADQKPRIAIRFAHEFNGNWYPYSNTPESYKAAWQHIHNTFEQLGVNQYVDWVWSASKTNVDDYSDFTVYYPGDNFVDWTSLDGYNWGSNYAVNGWSSFKDIFTNGYLTLVDNYPDKPIMIAETASAEPHDTPNQYYGMYGDNSDALDSKSVWVADMLQALENDFPAVRALSLFNNNKELSWSLTTSMNTGLDSWIEGTQSEHFTSSYLVASEDVVSEPTKNMSEKPSNGKSKSQSNGKSTSLTNLTLDNASYVVQALDVSILPADVISQASANVINGNTQRTLAQSKKPNKLDQKADRALAKRLRNLDKIERKQYIDLKLSVINY